MLLALVGGGVGVLLASWIVRTFLGLATSVLPRVGQITIDGRVLGFAFVLSLAVGVLCGLWPLVRMRTRDLAGAVREGDTRTGSKGGSTFGNGLVVAEIAVAFALVVGAGLLVKNLLLLQQRETGIRTERIVSFDLAPAGQRYQGTGRVVAFYNELLDRLRPMGGIEAVGLTSHLPMYRFGFNGEMSLQGGNPWGPKEAPLVEHRWIGGDYFKTGIPVLKGRVFTPQDKQGAPPVIVINKAMSDKFWPGQDPLGKKVAQGGSPDGDSVWLEVVGVVGDVRSYGLVASSPYEFYFSIDQRPFTAMTVAIRTASDDPAAVIRSARQIVSSIDPSLPVTGVQRMDQIVSASVGQPRLMSALSALFRHAGRTASHGRHLRRDVLQRTPPATRVRHSSRTRRRPADRAPAGGLARTGHLARGYRAGGRRRLLPHPHAAGSAQ